MTTPVVPPVVPGLPAPPLPTDPPAVFDDKAAAFVSAQVGQVPPYNGAAAATYHNALVGIDRANAAAASAAEAAATAAAVSSAANFKGLWDNLSGPLNMPATVKHNGRFWLLTRSVALVEAEEPGVSDAWTASTAEAPVVEVGASTVMQPGVVYGVTTADIVLSLPASVEQGDVFCIDGGRAGARYSVDWGAFTAKGEAFTAPMPVPAWRGLRVVYTGTTFIEG